MNLGGASCDISIREAYSVKSLGTLSFPNTLFRYAYIVLVNTSAPGVALLSDEEEVEGEFEEDFEDDGSEEELEDEF